MRKAILIIPLTVACSGTTTQGLLDGDFISNNAKPITLISPTNDQLVASQSPTFLWSNVSGVGKYQIQIARDVAFSQITVEKTVSDNFYTLDQADAGGNLTSATYYWRVKVPSLKNPLTSKANVMGYLNGFTIYVNKTSTATPVQGTQTNPYTTIAGAVAAVNALRGGDTSKPAEVRVAAGTYPEGFTLPGGIAIYGGYEATNWTRSITGNQTNLNPNAGSAVIIQVLNDATLALRATTIIDGFYFGQVNAASGSNGLITINDGSPTIQNNYFNSFAGVDQRCIYVSGGSPLIQANTINGATGTINSQVARFSGGTAVSFRNNTINLTGNMEVPFIFSASNGEFTDNVYTASMSNNIQGIKIDAASTSTIGRNTLQIAVTTGDLRAIYNDGASNGVIVNNLVTATNSGGGSIHSGAITMFDGSPIISNNTLIQRITGGTATYHVIYNQGGGASPVTSNNIILAVDAGAARTCLSIPTGMHVRNNTLINCSETVTVGAVGGFANSSGNVAYTWAQFNTVAFQGGAAYTLGMDMRLTAGSPTEVRRGGLNAANSVCGGGAASCGNVTVDRSNTSRTCVTAVTDCYSIGAYELD